MAKIISTLFISLDGVIEPDEHWHFPYFSPEMGLAVNEDYTAADTVLLGRATYDSFAGAWPDRETAGGDDASFAKFLGDARKIVASRQRPDLGWRNAELLDGDLVDVARALRDDPAVRGVVVPGSISVVRQLLAAGLIDELRLYVHPVAARSGEKLFDDGDTLYHLRLLSSAAFPTGVLRLIYAPTAAPGSTSYDDIKDQVPDGA